MTSLWVESTWVPDRNGWEPVGVGDLPDDECPNCCFDGEPAGELRAPMCPVCWQRWEPIV